MVRPCSWWPRLSDGDDADDCHSGGKSIEGSVTGTESHLVAITCAINTPFLDGEAELDARACTYVGTDAPGVSGSEMENRPRQSSGQTLRRYRN